MTVETCDPAGPSEPVLRMGGATLCLSDMPRPKAHRCPRVLVIPLADAGPHTAVYHSAPHPRLATAACVVAPTSEADGPCRALIVDHTYIVARADGWAGEESTPALQGERFGYFGDVPLSAVQLSLWVGLAHGAHLVVLPSLTCLLERGLREELSRRGITALALPVAALDHGVRKEAEASRPYASSSSKVTVSRPRSVGCSSAQASTAGSSMSPDRPIPPRGES